VTTLGAPAREHAVPWQGAIDEDHEFTSTAFGALKMHIRLAADALVSPTRRPDLCEWGVKFFQRQMNLDYEKMAKNVDSNDAFGQPSLVYFPLPVSHVDVDILPAYFTSGISSSA
jgi:hypothetical protein